MRSHCRCEFEPFQILTNDCRGGTPWPPLVRETHHSYAGAATECRPYNHTVVVPISLAAYRELVFVAGARKALGGESYMVDTTG
jgi:hypothetical protein